MNFSHGSYEYHQSVIDNARAASSDVEGRPLAIALDTVSLANSGALLHALLNNLHANRKDRRFELVKWSTVTMSVISCAGYQISFLIGFSLCIDSYSSWPQTARIHRSKIQGRLR